MKKYINDFLKDSKYLILCIFLMTLIIIMSLNSFSLNYYVNPKSSGFSQNQSQSQGVNLYNGTYYNINQTINVTTYINLTTTIINNTQQIYYVNISIINNFTNIYNYSINNTYNVSNFYNYSNNITINITNNYNITNNFTSNMSTNDIKNLGFNLTTELKTYFDSLYYGIGNTNDFITSTFGNATYIKQSNEINLNVNSSRHINLNSFIYGDYQNGFETTDTNNWNVDWSSTDKPYTGLKSGRSNLITTNTLTFTNPQSSGNKTYFFRLYNNATGCGVNDGMDDVYITLFSTTDILETGAGSACGITVNGDDKYTDTVSKWTNITIVYDYNVKAKFYFNGNNTYNQTTNLDRGTISTIIFYLFTTVDKRIYFDDFYTCDGVDLECGKNKISIINPSYINYSYGSIYSQNFYTNNLCINNDCKNAWPTSGGPTYIFNQPIYNLTSNVYWNATYYNYIANGTPGNITYLQTRVIELDNTSGTPAVLRDGQIYYTDGNDKAYNLVMDASTGVVQQIGEEIYLPKNVKNADSTNVLNCEPVYMSGSSGTNILIKHAKSDNYRIAQATIGLTTQQINVNAFGRVTTYGNVGECDTSNWVAGTSLFLNRTGGLSSSIPPKNETIVYIGQVLTSNANNGIIGVNIIIQPRLDDLSYINSTGVNKSILIYNNETGVWFNVVLDNYFDTNFTSLKSQIDNLSFNALRDNISRVGNDTEIRTNITALWSNLSLYTLLTQLSTSMNGNQTVWNTAIVGNQSLSQTNINIENTSRQGNDSLLKANIDNLTIAVKNNETYLNNNYYNTTTSDNRYLSAKLRLYFYNTSSPINVSYTEMKTTINPNLQYTTFNLPPNGETQLAQRLYNANLTNLPAGPYSQHTSVNITATGGAGKLVRLHSELYIFNATSNTSRIIGTSIPSDGLVMTIGLWQDVDFSGTITQAQVLSSNEYLLMILNASISGGGGQPSFQLIVGGSTGASLSLGVDPVDINPSFNWSDITNIPTYIINYTNMIVGNDTLLQNNINQVNISRIQNETYIYTNLTALWGNQSLYTLLSQLSTSMTGNRTEWSLSITSNYTALNTARTTALSGNITNVATAILGNRTASDTALTGNLTLYNTITVDYTNDTSTMMQILQNGSISNFSQSNIGILNITKSDIKNCIGSTCQIYIMYNSTLGVGEIG